MREGLFLGQNVLIFPLYNQIEGKGIVEYSSTIGDVLVRVGKTQQILPGEAYMQQMMKNGCGIIYRDTIMFIKEMANQKNIVFKEFNKKYKNDIKVIKGEWGNVLFEEVIDSLAIPMVGAFTTLYFEGYLSFDTWKTKLLPYIKNDDSIGKIEQKKEAQAG